MSTSSIRAAAPPRPTARLAGAVAGLLTALVAAMVVGPSAAAAAAPRQAAVSAARQSITAADRDFVVRVRLAGLWEIPAGRMAAEKGTTARVRQVGKKIAAQHVQLDELVVAAAAELGVDLPDEPNADQAYWLREMRAANGRTFDEVFAQRLREAHGKIFPAIASVRAGTRNPVVRRLADQANGFVRNHLDLLDSTGAVDHAHLPPIAEPGPEEARFVLLGDPRYPDATGGSELLRRLAVGLTVAAGLALAVLLMFRAAFPGQGPLPVRAGGPASPARRTP